jgi:hypothetical protein
MKKELIGSLVWAGVMLGLAFGGNFARKMGYIDGDTVRRLVSGAIGLWLVWYGNRMPKAFIPNACARQARRVAAWSLVLSGLAYAGLWAFAPIALATTAGIGAILAGMAVTFGYCLSLPSKANAG